MPNNNPEERRYICTCIPTDTGPSLGTFVYNVVAKGRKVRIFAEYLSWLRKNEYHEKNVFVSFIW